MSIRELPAFLQGVGWRGSRPGLERITELLRRLGDPQKGLKYIHVAGTNGKGSTAAMLASILTEAGLRTGLYISPHLVRYNERMQIDGVEITDQAFCAVAERIEPHAAAMPDKPTEFELVTAMAFQYFWEQNCDIVVLEVGLGGRLDATNVIPAPEVAVLTNLGLEHTEVLGGTFGQIAAEKGGILKPGCAAVSYDSAPEALAVLRELCFARGVPFTCVDFARVRPLSRDLEGQRFLWKETEEYFLPLLGEHQLHNAALALEAVEALRGRGWEIGGEAIRRGLKNTRWPARFELMCREPLFLLDGGHNPQCVRALTDCLAAYLPGQKATFLMGVLKDKDYEAMIDLAAPFARRFLCVTPESERALPADSLAGLLAQKGHEALSFGDLPTALRTALSYGDGPVVAFGSLYLAGAVREAFTSVRRDAGSRPSFP